MRISAIRVTNVSMASDAIQFTAMDRFAVDLIDNLGMTPPAVLLRDATTDITRPDGIMIRPGREIEGMPESVLRLDVVFRNE